MPARRRRSLQPGPARPVCRCLARAGAGVGAAGSGRLPHDAHNFPPCSRLSSIWGSCLVDHAPVARCHGYFVSWARVPGAWSVWPPGAWLTWQGCPSAAPNIGRFSPALAAAAPWQSRSPPLDPVIPRFSGSASAVNHMPHLLSEREPHRGVRPPRPRAKPPANGEAQGVGSWPSPGIGAGVCCKARQGRDKVDNGCYGGER